MWKVCIKPLATQIWHRNAGKTNEWKSFHETQGFGHTPSYKVGAEKEEIRLPIEELKLYDDHFQMYFRTSVGQFKEFLEMLVAHFRRRSSNYRWCWCRWGKRDICSAQPSWLVDTFVRSAKVWKNLARSEKQEGHFFHSVTSAFCEKNSCPISSLKKFLCTSYWHKKHLVCKSPSITNLQ